MLSWMYGYPSEAVSNEATAIYKNVTDKMYLLSIQEVAEWVEGRGYEWKREGTQAAKNQAENYWESNNYGYYWLRSPDAEFGDFVRSVISDGSVYGDYASFRNAGAAPAFTLNLSSALFEAGDGTINKPYKVQR